MRACFAGEISTLTFSEKIFKLFKTYLNLKETTQLFSLFRTDVSVGLN